MYFSISLDSLFYAIIPMFTGPFLLLTIAYFALMRRHIVTDFPLHACFIICFAIWLIGRPLQSYGDLSSAHVIIYLRFLILFSIGIPSMLIVNIRLCDIRINRFITVLAYLIGLISSLVFIAIRDGSSLQVMFDVKYGYILPIMLTDATYSDVLIFATIILLVIPNSYLIYYQLTKKEKKSHSLIFLIHALIFGISFIAGEVANQFWPLYIVSCTTILCWYWIFYKDIKAMKIQTDSLKNELLTIQSKERNKCISPDISKLLNNLEINEDVDLTEYKITVKNALKLIADQAIEESCDNEHLFTMSNKNNKANQRIQNTDDINFIETNEELELSQTTTLIPTQRNKKLIDKAISYIEENYHKDIELAEIALHSNVSDSYLIRTFKKVIGETPNQYIISYRIKKAQHLLKECSVNEASAAVGFKNYSYFSTVFKKITGLSPLQYQKKLLSK